MRPFARAAAFVVLGLLAGPVDGRPQGDARAAAEAQARRAGERIRALQREADALAARERTLLDDLRRLEVERDLRREQFNEGARELARIEVELADTTARIGALSEQAGLQLPDLSNRLVELYKLGNGGYVRLLFSVDDLREVGRAYRFVSALQTIDRQRLAEHQRVVTALQRERADLQARRARQIEVQRGMAAARDAATKAAASLDALVNDIDARRDLNARLVGELQAAQKRLQKAVADMAHDPKPDGGHVSLPLRAFKGELDWPASGRLLSRFGRQLNPRFHTSVASNGVLIGAAQGTPVRAVHEGTVAFAEPFPGFGNLVIVDHGNLAFTMYGHLADITAKAGSRLADGAEVGSVGTTIDGTPALYFEVRIDGKPVDPLQWLRKQ